jgi:hypothetical protein
LRTRTGVLKKLLAEAMLDVATPCARRREKISNARLTRSLGPFQQCRDELIRKLTAVLGPVHAHTN